MPTPSPSPPIFGLHRNLLLCPSIDTMLNFDEHGDGDGHGVGTYKQPFSILFDTIKDATEYEILAFRLEKNYPVRVRLRWTKATAKSKTNLQLKILGPRLHVPLMSSLLWAPSLIFLTFCVNSTIGLHWSQRNWCKNRDVNGTCRRGLRILLLAWTNPYSHALNYIYPWTSHDSQRTQYRHQLYPEIVFIPLDSQRDGQGSKHEQKGFGLIAGQSSHADHGHPEGEYRSIEVSVREDAVRHHAVNQGSVAVACMVELKQQICHLHVITKFSHLGLVYTKRAVMALAIMVALKYGNKWSRSRTVLQSIL